MRSRVPGGATTAVLAALLTTGCILSAPSVGSASDRIAALLDSIVPAELAARGTPGAAVAVVIGDSVAYSRGFGVASVESELPVTSDMLFRIASTTKMLTAATVLVETAKGSLTLDAPIGNTLPGLAPSIGRLTLRDLLRHRAGVREGSSYYGPQDESALLEFVRSWSDTMLFTEPGDVYSYSNLGYALAGRSWRRQAGVPTPTRCETSSSVRSECPARPSAPPRL